MSKKSNDPFALEEKIAHKTAKSSVYKRFDHADEALGVIDEEPRERIIRKSYALTKKDIENIRLIKDKCLNQRVVLSDSHIVRLAINFAATLSEDILIKASSQIQKIPAGRPKRG